MSTNGFDSAPDVQFKELVEYIFSKPPQDENTICLNLSDDSQDQFLNSPEQTDAILEFYVDIAIEGCKILFGENILITSLSEDQFNLLQKYMRSMGHKLVVKANDGNDTPWNLLAKNETIEKIRISVVAI